MKSVKNKRVGRAKMSTMPEIHWDAKTVQNLKQIMKMPERADRVRLLFLLDASNFLLERLRDRAPKVEMSGKEINYVDNMKIGILEERRGFDAVAMWLDGVERKITRKNEKSTALYFRLVQTSPEWVRVMVENNPWPATLVPAVITKEDAKIISRNIRDDERRQLEGNILSKKNGIEQKLEAGGLKGASIGAVGGGVGTSVCDDIGYNVLRKELGFDGGVQQAHWRPAFKALEKYTPALMQKVNDYMLTGRESIFNIPSSVESVDMKAFKQGDGFMKEIKAVSPIK